MAIVTPQGHGLGWRGPSLPDIRHYQLATREPVAVSVPATVDLRAQMPVVRDQGRLGACTAFAATTMAHFVYVKDGWHHDFVPSPLAQYFWERAEQGTISSDSGSDSTTALKVLATYGMTAEHNWPYDVTKFALTPSAAATANAERHTATSYWQIGQSVAAMQSCLASGFPFIFGFTVYASFESAEVASTGIVPWPLASEQVLGGHEMVACGYTVMNGELYIICQNSWGASFGDKGYVYLPAAYLANAQLAGDFWTLRVQH